MFEKLKQIKETDLPFFNLTNMSEFKNNLTKLLSDSNYKAIDEIYKKMKRIHYKQQLNINNVV